MRMRLFFGLIACTAVVACSSQDTSLYADWYDSAQVAKQRGDYTHAAALYARAFARAKPVATHALDAARVSWAANDTSATARNLDMALELGCDGDDLASDSTLGPFWRSALAEDAKQQWARFKSMQLPELKAELEDMFREDQKIRMDLDWEKAESPDSLVRRSVWQPVEAQDKRHYDRVVDIINEHGVPSVHQVGLIGNKMVYFAFIHSGKPELITPWILKLRESVEQGDSPPTWFAYLIDRVMVFTTKATMFGTTGFTDRSDDTTYFYSVLPDKTDLLREAVGLPRMGKVNW